MHICSQYDTAGLCAKMVMDNSGAAKWSKADCDDITSNMAVCATNQTWHRIGCYPLSRREHDHLIAVTYPGDIVGEPHKFCQQQCILIGMNYYIINKTSSDCQCLPTPLSGNHTVSSDPRDFL
jgi:hypothetical protein